MFHPSRGGVRGGKDQFSWEDVKEDKYREYYLGHSLMAPVGRWQKGKDLTWYSKETKDDKDRLQREELARIKEAEADAMAVALGVKKKRTIESTVTEEELRHAINRNDDSDDDPLDKVNEEKGLGYGRSNRLIPAGGQTVEVMNEGGSYTSSQPNYGGAPPVGSSSAAFEYEPVDKRSSKEKKKKSKKHKKTSSDKKKRHHRHRSVSDESRHRRHRDESPLTSRHSRHHRRDIEAKGRSHRSRSPFDTSVSPPPRQRSHRRQNVSPDRDGHRSAAISRGRTHRSPSTPRKRDRRTSRSPSTPRKRYRRKSRSPPPRDRSRSRSASPSPSPPSRRHRRSPSPPSSARRAPRQHLRRSVSPPSLRRQRSVSPPPQPAQRQQSRSPSPYTKRLLLSQKKGGQ